MLVAAGITVVLVALIVVVSLLTTKTDSTPSPSPKPETSQTPVDETSPVEPGVQSNPDGGSTTLYDNDYSSDEGYNKLSTNFDPTVSVTDNTVYNDGYVASTYSRLVCEFSTKKTITERALTPITNFLDDLKLSGTENARSIRTEGQKLLDKYTPLIGKRLDASDADNLKINCELMDIDMELENHKH